MFQEWKWFYDFGTMYNVKQVLGPKVWDWFIPVMPEHIKTGDGITFNTRHFGLNEVDGGEAEEVCLVIFSKASVNRCRVLLLSHQLSSRRGKCTLL